MKVLGNSSGSISDISEITLSNNNSLNDSGTVISTQSAIKKYVDSVASGLDIKDPCLVGTTDNIELNNTTTIIDNINLSNGDRILVKDQINTSENGIYIYNDSGPWNRADDFNNNSEIRSGSFSLIEDGNTNAYSGYVVTTENINIGVLPIVFSQFSGSDKVNAGTGLTKNGTLLSIDNTVVSLTGSQTLTNKVLTTPDINGGTIDGATIATSNVNIGSGKTLDVSSGTLSLSENQISGDSVEGGTIDSITINTLSSTNISGNLTGTVSDISHVRENRFQLLTQMVLVPFHMIV